MRYYGKNWRGTKWLEFRPTDKLPDAPACYAIYADGELVYVGKAVNFSKRIREHGFYRDGIISVHKLRRWGHFRRVLIKAKFEERRGDWAMLEYRLLSRLRPAQNTVFGGRKAERYMAWGH